MATWLYVKNSGGTLWYKYYCRRCREWVTFTTSWNLPNYGCEHYRDRLPWKDCSIAENPGWFAYGRWERWYDLDEKSFPY
jgi:hypothetical protein